jgi:hypothetical protein
MTLIVHCSWMSEQGYNLLKYAYMRLFEEVIRRAVVLIALEIILCMIAIV